MARSRKTSKGVGKTASKVLRTGKATKKEARKLAGSNLSQRAPKDKKNKKDKK